MRIPAKVFGIVSKTKRTKIVVANYAPMNRVLHDLCKCSREWCFQRTHSYCLDSLHIAFLQTRPSTAQQTARFGRMSNPISLLQMIEHSASVFVPTLIIPNATLHRSSPFPQPLRATPHSSCIGSFQPTFKNKRETNNGARLVEFFFLFGRL